MARKRHSNEDVQKLLREIEVSLASGGDVPAACRKAEISNATYYLYGRLPGCKAILICVPDQRLWATLI